MLVMCVGLLEVGEGRGSSVGVVLKLQVVVNGQSKSRSDGLFYGPGQEMSGRAREASPTRS